jgi:hypothetical protein
VVGQVDQAKKPEAVRLRHQRIEVFEEPNA